MYVFVHEYSVWHKRETVLCYFSNGTDLLMWCVYIYNRYRYIYSIHIYTHHSLCMICTLSVKFSSSSGSTIVDMILFISSCFSKVNYVTFANQCRLFYSFGICHQYTVYTHCTKYTVHKFAETYKHLHSLLCAFSMCGWWWWWWYSTFELNWTELKLYMIESHARVEYRLQIGIEWVHFQLGFEYI